MKRSHFIASIAAILLAPFVKTRPKEVLDQFGLDRKSGGTLWNGPTIFDFRIEDKYIIRDKHGNIRIWKSK